LRAAYGRALVKNPLFAEGEKELAVGAETISEKSGNRDILGLDARQFVGQN